MCGRFSIYSDINKIPLQLGIDIEILTNPAPAYNASPTQHLPVLFNNEFNSPVIAEMYWGLIPFWAKDLISAKKLFNARVETAAEKASFKQAFKKRRCLIPADGWFEWQVLKDYKQPYFHHRKDNKILFMAGLWDHWQDHHEGFSSFTILTQQAYAPADKYHDRMPVLINDPYALKWLDTELSDPSAVYDIIHAQAEMSLEVFPVTTAVGKPSFENPDAVKPLHLIP